MANPGKFDADKLRSMIDSGKDAAEICAELGINKVRLKNYLTKLMLMDEKFHKIEGMGVRITNPKVTKLGFKMSVSKMKSYGFNIGDEVAISKQADGEILIKKK